MPTSARTSCQHSHLNREGLELETPHPTHELAVAPSPSQLSGVVCTARCTTSSEILCRTLCRTGSSSGCIHLQPRCWNQDSGSMHGTASVQLCQRGRAAQPGTRYPLLYPTTDADKRRIGRRGSEPTAEPRSRSKISTSPQPAPEGSGPQSGGQAGNGAGTRGRPCPRPRHLPAGRDGTGRGSSAPVGRGCPVPPAPSSLTVSGVAAGEAAEDEQAKSQPERHGRAGPSRAAAGRDATGTLRDLLAVRRRRGPAAL